MRNFFENGICKLFGVQQRPTEKSMHNGDIENNKPGGNSLRNAFDENEQQIGIKRGSANTDMKIARQRESVEIEGNEENRVGSAMTDIKIAREMESVEIEGNEGKPSGNAIYVDDGRYMSKKTYDLIKDNNTASCWNGKGHDTLGQQSPMGNTVLHIAALYGNNNCVDQVIQNVSYLLDEKNSNGDTALHVAARAGRISTLKKLLAALFNRLGSRPEEPIMALEEILVKNKKGNTFFHEALLNCHEAVMNILDCQELHIEPGLKELVQRCALFWTNKEEKSVFHIAIEKGYEDMVKYALTTLNKLNQNHQDLAESIRPGLPLQPEYNIFITDMKTAGRHRNWSQRNGNDQDLNQDSTISTEEEATQLIPYGPHYDPPGKSPLNLAIFKRDQGMLDIILTSKKEWIHKRDNKGRIALHYAASIGYLQGVEILLRSCIYCNMKRDNDGLFPLHFASAGGHVEVIKILLEQCPDPREIVDKYGRNIVHIAAEVGMLNVVRYILEDAKHGLVDMINDKDAQGNTPLHLATLHYHPKLVHALTRDKRMDLSLVNRKSQTAVDVFMQSSQENPPLRQRLTWIALESGGVKYAKRESQSINAPIPLQRAESVDKHQAPNMDLYKDRINTLMLVSTLITTVTFAAGFTLPGGTNSSSPGQGMAFMLHHLCFKLFIFCITLSMYGSISVTIILIWAQLGDISLALAALKVARPLFGVTLATLSVAFMAGVHLVISDLTWLATAFLVLCVIFSLMLLLLYTILWFPSSSSKPVMRYISYYPFQFLTWLAEDETKGTVPETEPPPESFSNKFLHFTFFCRRCFSVTRSEMSSKEN